MILADKIIEERKRNGWSQEELAEKLSVSRQSVSKWESAQSVPDLNRILKMAEIFGVSTDYLLKDEMENQEVRREISESYTELRRVSMEEASEFLAISEKNAPLTAFGVSLCIASAVPLLLLAGLAENKMTSLNQNMVGGIGIISLFLIIAIAVFIFIGNARRGEKYEYLEKEEVETEYGVTGLVNEKKALNGQAIRTKITAGILILILAVTPVLAIQALELPDYMIPFMVGVMLLIISLGVNLILRGSIVAESYDMLLQIKDYEPSKKAVSHIKGYVSTIFWMIALAIYLGWSFISDAWKITWVVWPVAGVLFVGVMALTEMIAGRKSSIR